MPRICVQISCWHMCAVDEVITVWFCQAANHASAPVMCRACKGLQTFSCETALPPKGIKVALLLLTSDSLVFGVFCFTPALRTPDELIVDGVRFDPLRLVAVFVLQMHQIRPCTHEAGRHSRRALRMTCTCCSHMLRHAEMFRRTCAAAIHSSDQGLNTWGAGSHILRPAPSGRPADPDGWCAWKQK